MRIAVYTLQLAAVVAGLTASAYIAFLGLSTGAWYLLLAVVGLLVIQGVLYRGVIHNYRERQRGSP